MVEGEQADLQLFEDYKRASLRLVELQDQLAELAQLPRSPVRTDALALNEAARRRANLALSEAYRAYLPARGEFVRQTAVAGQ